MTIVYSKRSRFDPSKILSDSHIGRIGEHLVTADILINGYDCFHSAQGMPYDLVADIKGKLLRIQVKTTALLRTGLVSEDYVGGFYEFKLAGIGHPKVYTSKDFDLLAFVALPERSIGYITTKEIPKFIHFRATSLRGQYKDEKLQKRNTLVMEGLKDGLTTDQVADKFKISRDSVYTIRKNKSTLINYNAAYLDDLPLNSALIDLNLIT